MEPNEFIKEVYRRMVIFNPQADQKVEFEEIRKKKIVLNTIENYRKLLPKDLNSNILDIGFGSGWFMAACLELGYQNIHGAEFGIENKEYIKSWSPRIRNLYEIRVNIGDLLSGHKEKFDFIHMSHVIEHIPKYSLLYVVDALYYSLKKNGALLLRSPNMEGPCALSSLYVTLGHEYGFCGSNLQSLLNICGFEDIQIFSFSSQERTLKNRVGSAMRKPFLLWNGLKHRFFGVNSGGIFGQEIVAVGYRRNNLPLFDKRFE